MTKSEYIQDMRSFFGAGFITVTDLAKYLGVDRSTARKYTKKCSRIGYKIPIREIAENLANETR